MFASFFPNPKLFFGSALLWTGIAMAIWFIVGQSLGPYLSPGWIVGWPYPEALPEGADEIAQAAFEQAQFNANRAWTYLYIIGAGALFCAAWFRLQPHLWFRWSVVASFVILFVVWFQVQIDVLINAWYRTFYDLLQQALSAPNTVTADAYFAQMLVFFSIAMVAITVAVLNAFLVSHYIFRWRTAMNDYYVANWQKLRTVEGAAQRVQEDTMRFAAVMEGLGVRLIDSLMTLIAFLPILWGLSEFVKELPIIGEVPQALVIVAITWSVFGTGLLALAGIRLPGLEFRNQRVEAAYRKELVFGEDHADRAQPPTLAVLFTEVRRNYFRLYLNYLYFNIARYGYLQAGVMVPYVALAPSIVTATITLGVMQQILSAFGRVESSFQYLVSSWTTIIELISIYKRLQAFEAMLHERPLGSIEQEVQPAQ